MTAAMLIAVAFAFWAQGRGYRYRVMRHLFPHSRYAMRHPSIRGTRPDDHEGSGGARARALQLDPTTGYVSL